MDNEDKVQKNMEFIVEQQAQFAANLQKVEERVTRVEDLVSRLAAVTSVGFKELGEKISALVDAQIRTEESVATVAEKMAQLTEAQAHTDQRLNVIIDIISEGRSGQAQG
ncbi:MAG TPA: hypothetical protein VF507_06940 [Pyrinomonadaceae bacterium]|jgi:predicted  nucleic acid-binding Zn-ribbon protein